MGEAIEDIESDDSFENMDAEIELYDTKYVKKIQRKLKAKRFSACMVSTLITISIM